MYELIYSKVGFKSGESCQGWIHNAKLQKISKKTAIPMVKSLEKKGKESSITFSAIAAPQPPASDETAWLRGREETSYERLPEF